MTLTIEPLTSSNLEELVDLFANVESRHFSHANRASAEGFLTEPADVHVIGRADGAAVAFGMLRGWAEGYEVPSLGIAVRRDREGRGYGRAMMAELARLARERGATKIRLRVHPENANARHLYESCGYRKAGTERGETLMILELTASGADAAQDDLSAASGARLRRLQAARSARRCFIIGNGPGLEGIDLAKLRNEATFALSGVLGKLQRLDWTPTYVLLDEPGDGDDAVRLNALTGTTSLFPAGIAFALRPNDDRICVDAQRPDGTGPSHLAGGAVTFACLELAAYLGYQEIYMIGVGVDVDVATADAVLAAFAEVRHAAEARGISIVNATVGGTLEAFPRIDFEMLFRSAPAERLLVIDLTRMGDGTASGELKAAVLGNWPPDKLMHVFQGDGGQAEIAGGPEADPESTGPAERIAAFAPDLVLYRPVPETPALHELAMDLIEATNLPLAVWIVDDWPTAYARRDPAAAARLEADLRWLLARADARFSISPSMSAGFHERYGVPFVAVANGVDRGDWAPAQPRASSSVTLRYAGSLVENMTLASVGLVARAVERLAESGLPVALEIRSRQHWRARRPDWLELRHTTAVTSDLSATEYRRWLAEADILLLAYNFDKRSREYVRYSLANKLPECLASGAAVFAVGPDDVATIDTLTALDVGERVTVADEEVIAEALRRLVVSPEARLVNAQRAQAAAFSLFEVGQARRAFDATVGRTAAAHRAGEYPRDLHVNVDETAVVASLLEERRGPGHLMLDVGAQRGSSAIHFARLGWTVQCFEPHPTSREALARRFAGRKNVRIDPRAVGEAPAAAATLYDSSESSGVATLSPFLQTHRPAARVEVTTVEQIVDELDVPKVDFLKIDVEGLDLAVLRGVPWDRVRPDVVECEFEDAKTLALGHSWRDIAAYLQGKGYAVYVSEWHPIIHYGARHDWRRVAPFTEHLVIDTNAWGNLLAFVDDPGWPAVRRAFDRRIERGERSVRGSEPGHGRAAKPGDATRLRDPLPLRFARRGFRFLRRVTRRLARAVSRNGRDRLGREGGPGR